MENENLNQNVTTEKKSHTMRNILIVLAVLAMGGLGYFAYQNPELFKAELSVGTETAPGGYVVYIPNDYTANESDVGEVEVKAAMDMETIENFGMAFNYVSDKIRITGVSTNGGDYFDGTSSTSVSASGDEPFNVRFDASQLPKGTPGVTAGNTLFRLGIELVPGFRSGQALIGADFSSTSGCPHTGGTDHNFFCAKDMSSIYITSPNFRDGRVSVTGGAPLGEGDICEQLGDCSGHGYCDGIQCVCDPEYDGPRCNSCAVGYAMVNSECRLDIFTDLDAINLNIEKNLIGGSGDADGDTVIDSSDNCPNTSNLAQTDTDGDGVGDDCDADLNDIDVWRTSVNLHPTDDLALVMVPDFSGPVVPLTFQDVIFVAQPANVLNDSSLVGGRLVKGDASGSTSVLVEIEKADGTVIRSNTVTVTVPSGPIIEYATILGADSILKGSRIELSTKISDVNQIENIADIRTFVEGSGGSPQYTATPFIEEVEITNTGTEDEGEGDDVITENFRIYKIPVEIPTDLQMVDGDYDLRLEITDVQGNTASKILPIYIGEVATGDINQDGDVTLADVFLALQFSNGSRQPTNDEEAEADMDGTGTITMFDVILVFNRCKELGITALNPDGVCN